MKYLGNRLFVEPLPPRTTTKSGKIHLPENRQNLDVCRARVVGVGHSCKEFLREGDVVWVQRSLSDPITIKGKTVWVFSMGNTVRGFNPGVLAKVVFGRKEPRLGGT